MLLVLAVAMAACNADGCLAPERIVVVYRGDSVIEVKAPVIRMGETVGLISEVHATPGAQRVVVDLKQASVLRRSDRYLPHRSGQGVGFKVIPGAGEPLRNGDVVEAGFGWKAGHAPTPAVGGETAGHAGSHDAKPAAPPPNGASAPRGSARVVWSSSPGPGYDLERAGLRIETFTHVAPELRGRIENIPRQARAMPASEAAEYLSRELKAVGGEFSDAMREARERGDRDAEHELRELRIKTLGMLRRMRAQASQSR